MSGDSGCCRAKASSRRVSSAHLLQQQIGVDHDDAEQIVEVVGDAAGELAHRLDPLAAAELMLDAAPFGAALGLAQLPLDCRQQARQPVLGHEIVRAGAHRGDRDLLLDCARDDQERQVEAAPLHQRQRFEGAELRHRPVGDDGVPLAVERRRHRRLGIHALPARLVAAAAQFAQQQLGVVRVVLDDQQAQRPAHGARSFSTSQ